ncbi:hypothetical protein EU527_06140 [Candidatus Thorarchaeota archaeon]|nr:MAG: hypothetical protein EU527_06140 [Candidatus Thorarchaeota archaeon]
MGFDDISEFTSETSIGVIRFRILNLANGHLLLISDKDQYRLGVSAVAIPPGQGSSEPTSASLFSMGIDITLVRTLAERVAAWTNTTCMVIIGISQLTREVMIELLLVLKNHLLS